MVQLEEQSLLAPEDLCLNYANFIYRKLYRKDDYKEKDAGTGSLFLNVLSSRRYLFMNAYSSNRTYSQT